MGNQANNTIAAPIPAEETIFGSTATRRAIAVAVCALLVLFTYVPGAMAAAPGPGTRVGVVTTPTIPDPIQPCGVSCNEVGVHITDCLDLINGCEEDEPVQVFVPDLDWCFTLNNEPCPDDDIDDKLLPPELPDPGDDDPEDDDTPEDDTPEETPEDDTPEDDTPEETPEDDTPEDDTPEQTPEDDDTPQDDTPAETPDGGDTPEVPVDTPSNDIDAPVLGNPNFAG